MSNKTSDKEVASLEDIKVIQHIISFYKDLDVIHSNDKCKEIAALEHILAEQKQDKARIKELEEELEKANRQLDLDYVEENFIPKQQVKGKLKELKIERDKIYKEFIESNRLDKQLHVQGIYLDAQIIILQELLGGESK